MQISFAKQNLVISNSFSYGNLLNHENLFNEVNLFLQENLFTVVLYKSLYSRRFKIRCILRRCLLSVTSSMPLVGNFPCLSWFTECVTLETFQEPLKMSDRVPNSGNVQNYWQRVYLFKASFHSPLLNLGDVCGCSISFESYLNWI